MTEKYKEQREKEVEEYLRKKKEKEDRWEIVKSIYLIVIFILTIAISVGACSYRFSHPELTETQLTIHYFKNGIWLAVAYIPYFVMKFKD